MQAAIRAASVSLLTAYGVSVGLKLQVYPSRPRSIAPPTAFVDRVTEVITYPGITLRQRTPRAEVVVLHATALPASTGIDSAEAARQKDAFVDGFLDWVTDNYKAMDPNSTLAVVATEDDPNYVPDWMPPEQQRTYYATTLTLEGYAEN